MKKIIVVVIMLVINTTDAKIISSIGLQIGLNSTFQNWDYKKNRNIEFMNDMDIHYNSALYIETFKGKFVSTLLELSYLQKGGIDNNVISVNPLGLESDKIEVWNRIDYLCFSTLIKFEYNFKKYTPYLIAGPSFDYSLSERDTYLDTITNKFKKHEFSFPFGAGIGYQISNNYTVDFTIQYQPSLTNIFENENLTIINNLIKYNVGLQLRI